MTLAAGVAVMAAVVLLLTPPEVVSIPLGLVLLILPGLTAVRALHPGRLDPLVHFAAICGAGVALDVVLGLILTAFPSGITGDNWSLSLAAVSVVTAAVAVARGGARGFGRLHAPVPSLPQLALFVVGLAALTVAGVLSVASARSTQTESFTALSLVPSGAAHDPVTATSAQLTVTSHEQWATSYLLVVGSRSDSRSRTLTLQPGVAFHQTVPLPPGTVYALLYLGSVPTGTPYREVWLRGPDPVVGTARTSTAAAGSP